LYMLITSWRRGLDEAIAVDVGDFLLHKWQRADYDERTEYV
jgi:hypothetical protein